MTPGELQTIRPGRKDGRDRRKSCRLAASSSAEICGQRSDSTPTGSKMSRPRDDVGLAWLALAWPADAWPALAATKDAWPALAVPSCLCEGLNCSRRLPGRCHRPGSCNTESRSSLASLPTPCLPSALLALAPVQQTAHLTGVGC
eukprot:CAMPEP_0181187062 /NCGR_PEP_ID=MMETSP1096-20121128/10365_1 /TAXON_ID=156174 ORGANISM="Chrysochromulina ericina, Strain CCMP281" /NCGR_SAMPLE_ID=MMETSP1096 /ASSEMBLY_ACC=CAM_ASM_000453 /LENGTH=144 /DNA_ID=CAMNT_0023275997 /DNA_START=197 /DNA_END=631 /DNA_ORIENTATION=-